MRVALSISAVFITSIILAQSKTDTLINWRSFKEKSPAIHLGFNSTYEIGLGKFMSTTDGHHPFSSLTYFSSELKKYNNKLLWGPKVGVWASGGCCGGSMGLSLIYYTTSDTSSLKFRPEIGFGVLYFRLYYGYTISITNKKFWPISRNIFGVNLAIPTKKSMYR